MRWKPLLPVGKFTATVLLILLATLSWAIHVHPYQAESQLIRHLAANHNVVIKTRTVGSSLLRAVFGDEHFQRIVHVSILDGEWDDACVNAVPRLQYLQSLLICGRSFNDDDLGSLLRCKSLQALVLDATHVTRDGLQQFKNDRPTVWCHRSQRQLIRELRQWMELKTTDPSVPNVVSRWLPQEHFQRVVSAEMRGTDVKMHWLTKLQRIDSLQRLIFFRTNITDSHLIHLARLSNLRFLWLDGSAITDGGVSHLKSLVNLEELELQSTKITHQGLSSLGRMHKLRTLNIGRTSVGDQGMAALTKMEGLERLQLFGTEVTDKGLQHLRSLPNLKTLYLDGTRVTKQAVRLLREALPQVDISH